jgi:hypothetical protein
VEITYLGERDPATWKLPRTGRRASGSQALGPNGATIVLKSVRKCVGDLKRRSWSNEIGTSGKLTVGLDMPGAKASLVNERPYSAQA